MSIIKLSQVLSKLKCPLKILNLSYNNISDIGA